MEISKKKKLQISIHIVLTKLLTKTNAQNHCFLIY